MVPSSGSSRVSEEPFNKGEETGGAEGSRADEVGLAPVKPQVRRRLATSHALACSAFLLPRCRAELPQGSKLFQGPPGVVCLDSQPASHTASRIKVWGREGMVSRTPPCWGCPRTWDQETSFAGRARVKDSAYGNTTDKMIDLPNSQHKSMRVRSRNHSCVFSLTFLTTTLYVFHFSRTSNNSH